MPIEPYGGELVARELEGAASDEAIARAATLPQIPISAVALSDLYLLGVGALSPLTGFMKQADYESVLNRMTLANGLPWSMPITLPVTLRAAREVRSGGEVALVAPDGEIAALLQVEDVFAWSREREAMSVYGTLDPDHPGVARVYSAGPLCLAGSIEYVYRGEVSGFPALNLTPAETRSAFAEKGWRTIVAFQTRNPIHRAHEYLQKCAMEMVDGLLLHPLVGETKGDDVPADVRVRCYHKILEKYYPPTRAMLSVLPAAMRYAGPREAVFHAILRRNYGCTHFIVGRDHAGVGNYYGTYDAQKIFDQVDLAALGIIPLMFEHAFFCRECGQMASAKTCPHSSASHLFLSGTKVRERLDRGERPPSEFTRPEVADILIDAYAAPPVVAVS